MVDRSRILEYAQSIAREFQPEKIILFGSYAYGTPTEDSDVDLLVVMPHESRAVDKAIEIDRKVARAFSLDLLVRSPAAIAQRLAMNDFFIRDIVTKGVVLHENGAANESARLREDPPASQPHLNRETVDEWVAKAEGDYAAATRLIRAKSDALYDAVGFHSQQCVEKYLKALLQHASVYFPKTHDLTKLLALLAPIEPLWLAWAERLKPLNDFAVEFRYPGLTTSLAEAKAAFATCKAARLDIRRSLGLPDAR